MGVRGREETILNSTKKKNIFNIWNYFFTNLIIFKTAAVGVEVRGREEIILNSTEKKNIFNIWNYFFTNLFYFETVAVF